MPTLDVKKLITGFLVLAALASSSVFIFSGFYGNTPEGGPAALGLNQNKSADSAQSKVPSNVFVEPIPSGGFSQETKTENDDGLPPVSASPNLTNRLAENLTRDIIKTNPDGPQSQEGQPSLTAPDLDATVEKAVSGSRLERAVAAGWNVNVSDSEVGVLKKYDVSDVRDYANSLTKILRENVANPKITDLLQNGEPSQEAANAISLAIEKTDVDLKKLSVPQPFFKLHKKILTLLAYQKNALGLLAAEDLVKESLVMQSEEKNYYAAVADFQKELENAASLLKTSAEKDPSSLLSNLFGIKSAQAQFAAAVFDVPTEISTAGNWARIIWEWTKAWALQVIKNQIINKIMAQTLNWIQGGGKPQFVTNWRAFLNRAGNEAAGAAIASNKYTRGLCQSIGPLVKLQLQNAYLREPQITCTLDQVVQSVKNFYNDFRVGGWVGYGSLILPSGNYFGSLFQANELIAAEVGKKTEAEKADAETGHGFLSTRTCVKTGPSPFQQCMDGCDATPLDDSYTLDDRASCYSSCQLLSGQPECLETKNTTPGEVVNNALTKAIGAPLDNVIGAQNIVGIVNAFVNSMMNKLVQAGARGLAGLSAKEKISGREAAPSGYVDTPTQADLRDIYNEEVISTPSGKDLVQRAKELGDTPDVDVCAAPTPNAIYQSIVQSAAEEYLSQHPDIAKSGTENPRQNPAVLSFLQGVSDTIMANNPSLRAGPLLSCDKQRKASDAIIAGNPKSPYGEIYDLLKGVGEKTIGESAQAVPEGPASWSRLNGFGSTHPTSEFAEAPQDECKCGSGTATNPQSRVHAECQNNACVKVPGDGENECLKDSDCVAATLKHKACQNNACVLVPGGGADQCSADEECATTPTQTQSTKPVFDATTGWNGGVAYNSTSNNWLVVSQQTNHEYIEGRLMGNTGTALGTTFRVVSELDPQFDARHVPRNGVAAPRVAYSPDENRYLVVWSRYAGNTASDIDGIFLSSSGTAIPLSTSTQSVNYYLSVNQGLGGLSVSPQISYDRSNKKFVVVWQNGGTVHERTVSASGALGTLTPLPNSSAAQTAAGNAKLAVNPGKEYCLAYMKTDGKVGLRRVDATTGAVGSETIVRGATGVPSIAYNSARNNYLTVWYSGGTARGLVTSGCDAGGSAVTTLNIGANLLAPEVAYNPASNSYGVIGGHQATVKNRFVQLDSSGSELTTYDVFADATNGNYAPYAIAPNTADGTFGLGSSKDYSTFRFSPGNRN